MIITALISSFLIVSVIGDGVHTIKKRSIPNARVFPTPTPTEDKNYWLAQGKMELDAALNQTKPNTNRAKNVIIFLGDGMGFQTVMAARVYKGQLQNVSGEEGYLSFEDFPHVGLSKVYNTNSQVPDSAGTGTAYLSGVKTNIGMIGVDNRVQRNNCSSMLDEYNVFSIAKWSQDAGKRTGFVTTTRVTHATPANIYAHSAERNWEVDMNLPEGWKTTCPNLKDIAKQLVEDEPGDKLNVIMGGGYQVLNSDPVVTEDDPLSTDIGVRKDGRHLMNEWLNAKLADNQRAAIVRNRTALLEQDLQNTDYLMGIYSNDHLPYAYLTRENNLDNPTLMEMTEAAITVLDKSQEGYFLLVEGGKIDWAHHSSMAKTALDETSEFDDAIKRTLEIVDTDETLIIVTADHSHTMSVAGYPERGNPISGIADKGSDDIPYTTLLYATGPGYKYKIVDGKVSRFNPAENDSSSSFEYASQAGVPTDFETHGGEDVPIYAIGPWSHLFYKVHEQNFIPHAMAYASCVGVYKEPCLGSPMSKAPEKKKKNLYKKKVVQKTTQTEI